MIKILDTHSKDFVQAFGQILSRGKQDIKDVSKKVSIILEEVKEHKLQAIVKQVSEFDKWNPNNLNELRISKQQCQDAYKSLHKDEIKALHTAYERIFSFHQKQKQKTWIDIEENESILGQRYTPIERVGLYIPGGKASYPSSLLMNAIPAIVAGVESIVVCTPTPRNEINPLLLGALHICNIQEIY